MLASSSRQTITRSQSKICTVASHNLDGLIPRRIHRRHASTASHQSEPIFKIPTPQKQHSRIRHEPWSFTPDYTFQSRHRQSALAKYQLIMSDFADRGMIISCLRVCKEMKDYGVRPDLFIYNDLLRAAANDGLDMEAEAIMDDMNAMGISPDKQSYHHLLWSKRRLELELMWNTIARMQNAGIAPNAQTYSLILERPLLGENIEMAIQFTEEMYAQGIVPELHTAQAIIILATKLGNPRLAIEMAGAFEERSVRRLDNVVWLNCLISAAEDLYAEGVSLAWRKVKELGITPDEGLCVEVLHTAARHGLPDLGMDVLRVLKLIGASWQEHHLSSIIEAFCKSGRLKEAFETLQVMRDNGITPVAETAHSIFDTIKQDIDTIDGTWGILDGLRKDGKKVDITAINIIIQAAVFLGDIQRSIGAYKAIPDYGLAPNVDTFNFLLSACITVGHRDLGNHLLGEMKAASIKPDERTYERFIILCLTQTTYEDAFFYLEEMKGRKLLPSLAIYDAIIKKCVSVGDSRYTLALEEMEACGYYVSQALRDFIAHGGTYERPSNAELSRRTEEAVAE